MTAWLAGVVNFQLGHWPALTMLTLTSAGPGGFRLRHWPPLEATFFGLPSLGELAIFVRSDATGLLQLEHAILGLMLNTSALWRKEDDTFFEPETLGSMGEAIRSFSAQRRFTI